MGADDLATRVQEGWTDFDVALATPDMMAVVGRLGRVLGPQGKMPNPRRGTITFEIAKAVEEIKAGKIEYRTENRAGLVHVVIGASRSRSTQLVENYASVLDEILRVKPASAKGRYIHTITLAIDHGPRHQDRSDAARATCSKRRKARRSDRRIFQLPAAEDRRQPPHGGRRPAEVVHVAEPCVRSRSVPCVPAVRWAQDTERRWTNAQARRKRSSPS